MTFKDYQSCLLTFKEKLKKGIVDKVKAMKAKYMGTFFHTFWSNQDKGDYKPCLGLAEASLLFSFLPVDIFSLPVPRVKLASLFWPFICDTATVASGLQGEASQPQNV